MHLILTTTVFFLVLLSSLFLDANENENVKTISNALAYGDSSGIVSGHVNVITGDFIDSSQDLFVPGPSPLSIDRFHATSTFHHCTSSLHGGFLNLDARGNLETDIGKGRKVKECRLFLISPQGAEHLFIGTRKDINQSIEAPLESEMLETGFTNSTSGYLSGQTNIKNDIFRYHDSGRNFDILNGNGTKTHYDVISAYGFHAPTTVTYPNGNKYHISYRSKEEIGNARKSIAISKMTATNCDESKVYGSISCRYEIPDKNYMHFIAKGSNGQEVKYVLRQYPGLKHKYTVHQKEKTKKTFEKQCVEQVISSNKPTVKYVWEEAGKDENGFKHEQFRISKKILPEERTVYVNYNDDNTVKRLFAPAGVDNRLLLVNRFEYTKSPSGNPIKTKVYDALNHKTHYLYPEDGRLQSILRYSGRSNYHYSLYGCINNHPNISNYALYSKEQFTWGLKGTVHCGFLRAHRIEDKNGRVNKAILYDYDPRGNVIKETLFGNLTGHCTVPIKIDEYSDLPTENGVDKYTIYRTFSDCRRNLILSETDGKKKVEWRYLPNTNLVKEKFVIVDEKIILREYYDYNDDRILERKMVDDGSTRDRNNLTGVTERRVTAIVPTQTPIVGLPGLIEERYYDLTTHEEYLLTRKINTYNNLGRIIREEKYDAHGDFVGASTWDYDAHGNVICTRNILGQTTRFRYDANDNLIYKKGPDGSFHQKFEYDFMNRLIAEKIHVSGGEIYTRRYGYNLIGNQAWESDLRGNETCFTYDEMSRLKSKTTQCGSSETYTYNVLNQLKSMTHPNGSETRKKLTVRGQDALIRYPDGSTEKFRYDLFGRLIEKRQRNLTKVRYRYDALDREIECKVYAPSGELLTRTKKNYNAFHLISETDPNGNTTYYRYDGAGRLISTKKGDRETRYGYDALGRRNATYEIFGDDDYCLTKVIYDLLDREIERVTEDRHGTILSKVMMHYDVNGNVIEVAKEGQAGLERTLTSYDCFGRVISITDPLGYTTRTEYDDGSISTKTVTDPNGNKTIEVYNEENFLVKIKKVDSFNQKILERHFAYDLSGNLILQTEIVPKTGKRILTAWEYDSCNREVACVEAMGTPEQKTGRTTYAPSGEKASQIKPDGVAIFYEYDCLGNMIARTSSDRSVDDFNQYDLNGNLLVAENRINGKAVYREYDQNDQLRVEQLSNGLTLRYEYDRLGRVTMTHLSDHSSIAYGYDATSLRSVNRIDPSGVTQYSHTYDAFDHSGRISCETHIGELDQHTYTYDLRGRLLRESSKLRNISVPENGYDPTGKLLQWHLNDGQGSTDIRFAYNALDHLIKEEGIVTHTYACDSLSNRMKKDDHRYRLNHLNQILEQQNSHYSYDLNGNRISKKSPAGTIHYRYDALNRLVEAVTETETILYEYDFYHRRISRTENGRTESYLYREMEEIGSFQDGAIKELKVLGLGEAIAVELQGTVYGVFSDQFGNLAVLADPHSGEAVTTYRYGMFGDEVAAGDVVSPWRYQQKRHDPVTGLVYFGYRDYDIELGSWSTPDPLGFADGPNLYAYVHHNPVMLFDPDGTMACSNTDQENQSGFFSCVKAFFQRSWDAACSATSQVYEAGSYACGKISEYKTNVKEHLKEKGIHYVDLCLRGVLDEVSFGTSEKALGPVRCDGIFENALYGACSGVGVVLGLLNGSSEVKAAKMGYNALNKAYTWTYIKMFKMTRTAPQSAELISGGRKVVQQAEGIFFREVKTSPIWTNTKQRTSLENAYKHWKDHGSDFPWINNAKQYVEATRRFFQNPTTTTLKKFRPNGDHVFYDPVSNTFGILDRYGVPRTMYKPTLQKHDKATNLEYFYGQ